MTSQIGLALRKMKGLRFADAAATPDATGEYMQFDGCFTGRDIGELSDHGYSYSMGIGASWSVQVPHRDTLQLKACYWRGGNAYNYGAPGHDEPHYPVPALANTEMVCLLGHYLPAKERYAMAWDQIWRDNPACGIEMLPLDWYFAD